MSGNSSLAHLVSFPRSSKESILIGTWKLTGNRRIEPTSKQRDSHDPNQVNESRRKSRKGARRSTESMATTNSSLHRMESLLRLQTIEFGQEPSENTPKVMTYGGTETQLIYQFAVDLPEFAAFVIPLNRPEEQATMEREVQEPVIQLATEREGAVLLLDAATYRASPDWLSKLGMDASEEGVLRVNQAAVDAQKALKAKYADTPLQCVISAEVGPKQDAYTPEDIYESPEAAAEYHGVQIGCLKSLGVELVVGWTQSHAVEAAGIAIAAARVNMPCMCSCTVETNGLLPDGTSVESFVTTIEEVCSSQSLETPLCYLINCAHPTHFIPVLEEAQRSGAEWLKRFGGIRPNASEKSHEELDVAETLDRGDPEELGRLCADLRRRFGLGVIGGCCGTDIEHLREIARQVDEN